MNAKTFRLRFLLLLLIPLALTVAGCGAKQANIIPMWPHPPDPPKIKYEKAYFGPTDLQKSSIMEEVILGGRATSKFIKPNGIHIDSMGRMLVCDTARNSVFMLDFKNRKSTMLNRSGRSVQGKPISVTSDTSGRFFVADGVNKNVTMYDKNGNYINVIAKDVEFKRPTGTTFNKASNKLYVTDTGAHEIKVIDGRTLKLIDTIGKGRGAGEGYFNFPGHLAVNSKGHLHVVDTMNARVQVFDSKGNFLLSFGGFGDGPGLFSRPKGIAIDSEDHIYVSDAGFNNVQIFNDEGQILMHFTGYGTIPGATILPAGLAIDADDYIYLSDSWNERINIYEFFGKKHDERKKKGIKLEK